MVTPEEAALKSLFPGPRVENADWLKGLIDLVFESWCEWRRERYPADGLAITAAEQSVPEFRAQCQRLEYAVKDLLRRFQGEVPSFSPRYIGHMLSEISVPALIGHIITVLHNPNNVSEEVSRVALQVEWEAVQALARMVGYDPNRFRGHFTTGGTIANFEAGIRARSRLYRWLALGALNRSKGSSKLSLFEAAHLGWTSYDELAGPEEPKDLSDWHPLYSNPFDVAARFNTLFGIEYRGPVLLVPDSKHYSWPKAVSLLGFGREAFWPVQLNRFGRLSLDDLRAKLELAEKAQRPIAMVVSVAGTTELGDFDPVDEVSDLLEDWRRDRGLDIWHHVDAAYGGFFCTLPRHGRSPATKELFRSLDSFARANSITIDPHKLGYVPYSSGSFLCSDVREYYSDPVSAPYLHFDQEHETRPQTLEGSRSAGGAVATWLIAKTGILEGEWYGRLLEQGIHLRQELEARLYQVHDIVRVAPHSETNILCFALARSGEALSATNARTHRFFKRFAPDADREFFVSETCLRWPAYAVYLEDFVRGWEAICDVNELRLIRLCIMNPFIANSSSKVDYLQEFIDEVCRFAETSDVAG